GEMAEGQGSLMERQAVSDDGSQKSEVRSRKRPNVNPDSFLIRLQRPGFYESTQSSNHRRRAWWLGDKLAACSPRVECDRLRSGRQFRRQDEPVVRARVSLRHGAVARHYALGFCRTV